ncbi:hypothetical protein NKH47_25810 [Mesorhizobium sp. M1060]|uniref:hypothetical protein n=1 Tax=Mesorhizobium sp. M1060 TaxID=2957052 RepID=UPI00333CE2FA
MLAAPPIDQKHDVQYRVVDIDDDVVGDQGSWQLLRARIVTSIEDVYNRQRLHSALDYLTPEEYEKTLSTPSENAPFELTSMKLSRNFSVSQ